MHCEARGTGPLPFNSVHSLFFKTQVSPLGFSLHPFRQIAQIVTLPYQRPSSPVVVAAAVLKYLFESTPYHHKPINHFGALFLTGRQKDTPVFIASYAIAAFMRAEGPGILLAAMPLSTIPGIAKAAYWQYPAHQIIPPHPC